MFFIAARRGQCSANQLLIVVRKAWGFRGGGGGGGVAHPVNTTWGFQELQREVGLELVAQILRRRWRASLGREKGTVPEPDKKFMGK